MVKNKAQAAVLDLIAELKQEGIETINEGSIPRNNPIITADSSEKHEQEASKKSYKIAYLKADNISPWKLANRLYFDSASNIELENSIKLQGQKIPAIVRKKFDGYELICGARRLKACQSLGIDLLAAIIDVNDKEAALIMDVENREREDITPYERGVDYKKWITNGIYKNQKEIVQEIGIKKSILSQFIALADLDTDVVDAFPDKKDITLKGGYALKRALEGNPGVKNKVIDLIKQKNSLRSILKKIQNVEDEPSNSKNVIKKIRNSSGSIVAEVTTNHKKKLSINFVSNLSEQTINEIVKVIEKIDL